MINPTTERVESVDIAANGKRRQRSLNFWKLEIAAAIVSLASLGVVIWELTTVNNTLLVDWHHRVSPNAFLSIFITLAKTGTALCLGSAFAQLCWLFYLSNSQKLTHIDNFASAREGPFGSFLLLFKLQPWGLVPTVARFGALTVLLALAMDPFAQQILGFDNRQVVLSENTTSIPSTRSFATGISILADNGFQQALFGPLIGIDIPMHFSCVTGNCTYPDFVSLGFCSQCTDVASDPPPQCAVSNATRGCPSVLYNLPSYKLSLILQNGSLPGSTTRKFDGGADQKPNGIYSLVKSAISDVRPNGLQNTTIFEFVIAQLRTSQVHPNITLPDQPAWNVSACSIRWCGKLYRNLTAVNGVLQNTTPLDFDLKPDPNSNCWKNGTCQEFLPIDASVVPQQLPHTFKASADSFTIRSLLSINSEVPVTDGVIVSRTALGIANSMLWNVNMNMDMKRVVKSMTDYIRSVINSEPIEGSSYQYKVYITVEWAWFALPCAVTAFSLIFMVIVMWMTSSKRSAMWKSSSVPLVMSGLRDTHDYPRHAEPYKRPDAEEVEVRVQLTREDNGQFKFRRTGGLLDDTDAR